MVDFSSHIRRGHPVAFGLLTFTSLIVAIIASVITSDYNKNFYQGHDNLHSNHAISTVRFLTFTGWFSFVFSIAYLVLFLTGIGGVVTSIAGHGLWLFIDWLFFLAGAGSIANLIGTNCGEKGYYYCTSLKALEAFSWISWIFLTFMLITVIAIGGGAFRGGRGLKDGLSEA